MAASSAKDKANALKDSYVAGLIDAAAAGSAPTMREQDMGEQASVYVDLNSRRAVMKNDGNPTVGIIGGYNADEGARDMNIYNDSSAAYPVSGQKYGAEQNVPLNDQGMRHFANQFYNQRPDKEMLYAPGGRR